MINFSWLSAFRPFKAKIEIQMTSMDGGFRRREYGHYVYEAALISNKAEVYSPFTNEELVGEVLKPFSNEVVIAFFHKQVNQTILVRI